MGNMKDKLNAFAAVVIKDAGDERDELMHEVREKHDKLISMKENDFLKEAYGSIQHGVAQAKKSAREKVLQTELEEKKAVLLTRENIIKEVMDGAKDKLKEYVKTEAYEAYLFEKIKKAIKEVGDGSKIIYVSSDDIRLKDKIEGISDDIISVEADDEKDFIGGVKVFNKDRKVSVDYSFNELLSEEKKKFLQSSGLTVD